MAQVNLNLAFIQEGTCKDLVPYFRKLRQNLPDVDICQSLFQAVNHDNLQSRVFSAFLSLPVSPETIILCIRHGPSRSIRRKGIKHFGKAMANINKWSSVWNAAGGTKGIIDLLSKSSVTEANAFAREIKRCNRSCSRVTARESAVEELLRALLSSHYPSSKLQSSDKRPIEHQYAQLMSACAPEFVEDILDAKDRSNPLYLQASTRHLVRTHGDLFQKRAIEGISGEGCQDDDLRRYLDAFVYNQPSAPSVSSKQSASMAFAEKVLRLRLRYVGSNKRWPFAVSEFDIFFSLFRRSVNKRRPEVEIHGVVMLGLHLLEARPNLKSAFFGKKFWSKLITRWRRRPGLYENSLALALRLELDGGDKGIGEHFYRTSSDLMVKPELIWPLLRLYCLHVPKNGIDLDTADDLGSLPKQQWPAQLFYRISKEQAVRLLRSLYDANSEHSFLKGPPETSILGTQDIKSRRNFNVELLLTILQRDFEDNERIAASAIDEIRNKAVIARDQSDRAELASAAHAYAIASGSLNLYGETVIWLQRYVRDTVAVNMVFRRASILTREGIQLLSGIPLPLPENMTLLEVASRVEKANRILLIFHDTIRIAKREPSFHATDWAAVISLFGKVLAERVSRAKGLQKHHWASEADVYTAIWEGTLAMLEEVNVDFLNEAHTPISTLLKSLPPKSLAATTKAMLEAGDEKRKKQDREPADDILERLSYDALLMLSKSENPELAQKLILQTIVGRPDASSWHRRLLSVSFLKSLTAKDAHQMLLAFANAIGEKLEEQSYVKVGEQQRPPLSAPPVPSVKVTTVKYLAQLLHNAEFISLDAAIDVLVELFKAGTHRDIRLATLDSLLNLLNNLCNDPDEDIKSNALVEKILKALEAVIPVAGSINERRPPRPQDWEDAKQAGTVLEISDTTDTLPPLLNSLLNANFPLQLQGEVVARYFLPILRHSQNEHQEWIALFLSKHKANFTADDVPSTPISPTVWYVLIEKFTEFIPDAVLADLERHINNTIIYPDNELEDFTMALRSNTALANTPDVQHWLSIYGKSRNDYAFSGIQKLIRMMYHASLIRRIHHDSLTPKLPDSIVWSDRAFDICVAFSKLCIRNYESYINMWELFVDDLRHPTRHSNPAKGESEIRLMNEMWQETGRSLLQTVADIVAQMNERYEQERKLTIFPSLVKLQVCLLPYPCFPDPAELDQQCKVFATELSTVLDGALKVESNALRWPKIAEDTFPICKHLNTDEERLRVALYFGELSENPALDMVRISLATMLIERGYKSLESGKINASEEELTGRLRGMLESWQSEEDYGVREKVMDWKRLRPGVWKYICGPSDGDKR